MPADPPGVTAAGVYDAGLSRAVVIARLQDPVTTKVMNEPRAYTEAEASAAYEAVAV